MAIIALRLFLILISVSGLMAVIQKNNERKLENYNKKNKNYVTLQLPRLFFWLGVVCTVIFALILILFSFSSGVGILKWVFFIALSLLGAMLIVAASLWKIEINRNDDYFNYTTSFGRHTKIYYADITAWNETKEVIKFKAGGKRYYVDHYAENYKKFLSILRQRAATVCKSKKVIRYPKGYLIVGIIVLVFLMSMIILMSIFPNDTAKWWVYCVFIGFILLGIYLVLGGINFYLILESREFIYRDLFRRTHTIPYSSIVKYKFGRNNLTLYTKKKRIFFDNSLPEYDELVKRLPCNRDRH